MPGIHRARGSARDCYPRRVPSGVCRSLDPGDKPRDDNLRRLFGSVAGGADDAVDLEGEIAARFLHGADELAALVPDAPVRLLLLAVEVQHLDGLRLHLLDQLLEMV